MKSLVLLLALLLSPAAWGQIIKPGMEETNRLCGPKIKTDGVMVLDLEPFGDQQDAAMEFAVKHAGEFELVNSSPEEIMTKWSHAWYDRDSGIKRAQKEAAKRGCDLVLVLEAGIYRDKNVYSDSEGDVQTAIRDTGYAVVVMGTRQTAIKGE